MKLSWEQTENGSRGNCSAIDYSGASEDELLNCFRSNFWSKINEENRIMVIQELENRNASRQGREAAQVVPLSSFSCLGQYNDVNNQISIDVENFTSYDVLDTYIHENNHAYQAHCIRNGTGYDKHTLGMLQAETARDGYGNLYNYAVDTPMYDMQCNELDSNNKAAAFLVSQNGRYHDDPQYAVYIEERAVHFNQVNGFLEKDKAQRIARQNIQIHEAYQRGDISREQYFDLNWMTKDENYVDATVFESQSVENALNTLASEIKQEHAMNGGRELDYTGGIEGGGIHMEPAMENCKNDYSIGI